MRGVLEGLTDSGGGGGGGEQTGGTADQTPQIDQTELEEQVNDLGKLGLFVILIYIRSIEAVGSV